MPLDTDYQEVEELFTQNGSSFRRVSRPNKMSAYGLAISLTYSHLQRRDIFEEYFFRKIKALATTLLRQDSLDQQFTKEELATAPLLLRRSLPRIITHCFGKTPNQNLQYITLRAFNERNELARISSSMPEEFDGCSHYALTAQERSDHNHAIFILRAQEYLSFLLHSPFFKQLIAEYHLVRDVVQHPERFPELEALCRQPLHHFSTRMHVRGIDSESQHQEGLLTIWKCAQDYEARNLARFPTMVREALRHKFLNLLRYSQADCRRVEKFTHSAGSLCEDDSTFFSRSVEDLCYRAWRKAQQEQLRSNGHGPDLDPFSTAPLLHVCKEPSNHLDFGTARFYDPATLKAGQEVTADNFPHYDKSLVGLVNNANELTTSSGRTFRPFWLDDDSILY